MADDPYAEFGPPVSAGDQFSEFGPPVGRIPLTSTGIAAPQGIAPPVSGRDIFTGMAQGAANTVGSSVSGMAQLLNKFPYVGEMLAPQSGIDALRSITAERSKPQNRGQKIGRTGEQIGEFLLPTGFEAKAVSLLPKAMQGARFIPSLARVAVVGGETGIRSASQGSDFGTGAAVGAATGVVGEIGRVAAPKLIEKALGLVGRDAQYGKTPGLAILENTTGLTPSKIAKQGGVASQKLTKQMEAGVHAASGTLSTNPAHDVIDKAIADAPRNARIYKEKLAQLKDVLHFDEKGMIGPVRRHFGPDEILEMKRGVEKEVSTWERELRKSVDPVKKQIYSALDQQLDMAISGNDALNQRISSLITGTKAANATAMGRPQQMLRMLARRGAVSTVAGGLGYAEGGPKGALEFGGAALTLQTPAAQIAIARLIKSGLPERLARGIVAGGLLNKGGK